MSDDKQKLQWGRGGYTAEIGSGEVRSCDRSPGFNGAAVVTPRKFVPFAERRNARYRLQWGRGGYTAEIRMARVLERSTEALQWGRGGYTAEIRRRGIWATEGPLASMGPRWLHRGNRSEREMVAAVEAASMGPRWLHRGNPDRRDARSAAR